MVPVPGIFDPPRQLVRARLEAGGGVGHPVADRLREAARCRREHVAQTGFPRLPVAVSTSPVAPSLEEPLLRDMVMSMAGPQVRERGVGRGTRPLSSLST